MDSELMTKLLNSENLQDEISKLSFDQKRFILGETTFLSESLLDRIFDENISFFNRDESLEILYEYYYLYYNATFKRSINDPKLLDLKDEDFMTHFLRFKRPEILRLINDSTLVLNNIEDVKLAQKPYIFEFLKDEVLFYFIVRNEYKQYFFEILKNFKHDSYKMHFLYKVNWDEAISIICSMDEKNIKRYITPFTKHKGLLISKLSSDEEKEFYLQNYQLVLTPTDRANILSSFNDKKFIQKNINYLNTQKALSSFVLKVLKQRPAFFDEDLNYYLKLINYINSELFLTNIIVKLYDHIKDFSVLKEYLDKISNPKVIYNIFCDSDNEELIEYILPKMSQKYIQKYVKENIEDLKTYKVLIRLENRRLFFEALEHFTQGYEYSDDILPIFKRVSRECRLNLKHLIRLAKLTNCSILSQVTNPNVINAINLDDINFEKYIKIFNKSSMELNNNSITSILYSLLNSKFAISFPNEVQIFTRTLHAVDSGNIDEVKKIIIKVGSVVNLNEFGINVSDLITGVINKDKQILELYNKITHEYLVTERNNYVNKEMESELNTILIPLYNVNDLIKYTFRISSEDEIYKIIIDESQNLDEQYKEIINNENLLKRLISFKKNPGEGFSPELKKYLNKFNKLLELTLASYKYRFVYFSEFDDLKIEREFPKVDKSFLIEVMSELDVQKMKDLLFNNENLYYDLLKYLKRYSVLGWGNRFEKISEAADIDMDPDVVAALISSFGLIKAEKERQEHDGKPFSFVSELSLAECLSCDGLIYQDLIGREDYHLLRRNPYPNRSPEPKKERLQKAVEYLRVMHNRKYITVPPVNKNFKLASGKSLNIVLGDVHNSINLTYGERTKSCMRIGGAGETLFDFCLKNENGFHISFNDPETGELVSRVSCYRNGNTVFCNQVRESLSKKYTNGDIMDAAALIAREIIERTKNSRYPVMNVVTSNSIVFGESRPTNIHCKRPTQGFTPDFYTDIESNAVILATRNSTFSRIELGPNNCERYEVGRGLIKKYSFERASDQVVHIEVLDAFLGKIPIEQIKIDKKKLKYAYVGEDWYVAITDNNKIISYIEKNSSNLQKAQEEMNKYLSIIQDELTSENINLKKKTTK